MVNWKAMINPILCILAPVISLCYLITPLTNDARIYLGVEHIAANFYPFPQGIDLAWEIKPIANRITNFILYKIATFFVPFEDHFLFGVAVKLVTLIIIVFIAWYFSRVIAFPYAFWLIFYTFTTMANFCVLQAEYWAVMCAVLALAMLVSGNRTLIFLAGSLCMWICFLKGITGLLIFSIVLGAFLLRRDLLDRGWSFISGFVCAGLAFFLMWRTVWPNIVSDILISPHLARVGSVPIVNNVVWFVAQLIMSPLYIPVLLIGIVFGAIFFFAWVRFQERVVIGAYVVMWLVPAAVVFIQGEMFLYHYLAFVPAAIVSVVLCEREGR